jgi:hypothetical protein
MENRLVRMSGGCDFDTFFDKLIFPFFSSLSCQKTLSLTSQLLDDSKI